LQYWPNQFNAILSSSRAASWQHNLTYITLDWLIYKPALEGTLGKEERLAALLGCSLPSTTPGAKIQPELVGWDGAAAPRTKGWWKFRNHCWSRQATAARLSPLEEIIHLWTRY